MIERAKRRRSTAVAATFEKYFDIVQPPIEIRMRKRGLAAFKRAS